MSTKIKGQGECLCGAVGISTEALPETFSACHCSDCRRWGGGPLMTFDLGSDVTLTGTENIGVFDSSDWAERGFCLKCGTHLFYRLKEGQHYFAPVDLFRDLKDIQFDLQIFIEEKPDYYEFSNKTQCMTGAELFAAYGASDS